MATEKVDGNDTTLKRPTIEDNVEEELNYMVKTDGWYYRLWKTIEFIFLVCIL